MMRTAVFALAMMTCAGAPARAQTYVGVLEEDFSGVFPEFRSAVLRAAFVKTDDAWQTARDSGTAVAWTIGFDGRVVGRIVTPRPQATSTVPRARGVLRIDQASAIPRIGEASEEFGGWSGAAVHRPLVATSAANVADPERWRRAEPDRRILGAVRRAFRSRFPTVENCANSYENIARPWAFSDNAIVLERAYRNAEGWRVLSVRLDGYNCDGPTDGPGDDAPPFATHVFAVPPAGEPRHLGYGMWLVDAGDYDNDGVSELIFAIDRYNRGGYELFSADFTAHAVFSFVYH